MPNKNVHIFLGNFPNLKSATDYTQEYWDPEPDDSVSDEEYFKWENENPKWKMRDDLGISLDSDFIETINENKLKYFSGLVKDQELVNNFEERLNNKETIMVLIFDSAFGEQNSSVKMKSTEKIEFIGTFPTQF